jgi:hypothetical protein
MWHNVIFKASFERVQKDGEGPFPTYHMDRGMTFMPPAEGVQHINENVTLLMERELTCAETLNLLHEISKFVQEDPGPWKNKPKSLLYTASFAFAQNVQAGETKELPQVLVEETACHLPAHELAEFIKINKYIHGLKDFFSDDGLQKLLFHFFKTYERPDLSRDTKRELKRVKKCLKWGIFDTTRQAKRKNVKLNWVLTSLGLFKQLDQYDARYDYEYRFHALKFRVEKQHIRLPIPEVNFAMSRYLQRIDPDLRDVAELDDIHVRYDERYVPPTDLAPQFFSYLCGMEESMWRGSYPEVLAYGAHILSEEKWSNSTELEQYFMHVWGNMAVALAKLNVPEYFSLSCLFKLAPKCFAFELEEKHYKQMVLSAYGQYEQEEKICLELIKVVPTYSYLFRKIIVCHMSTVEKRVEDMLMDLYDGLGQLESQNDAGQETDMLRLQKSIVAICNQHSRLMHVVSSLTKCQTWIDDYEIQISYMKFYKQIMLCFENCTEGHEDFCSIMSHITTHLENTWNFKIEVDSFQEYQEEMQKYKRELQKQTRQTYPKGWADACYVHLLFSKALRDFQPASFLRWLYDEALEIYTKLEHPRAERLKRQYKRAPLAFYPRQFQSKCYSECSFGWLLQNTPRIKGLIRTGIASLKRFDILDSEIYWNPLN